MAEALGGALLTLGALTPVAGAMLTGTMVTAIRKVHLDKGVWSTDGGYEYNAVLIAAVFALAQHGPGRPSVDESRFPRMHGTGWALAQLAAGAAGSFLVTRPPLAQPEPEADVTPSTEAVREESPVDAGASVTG